MAMEPKVSGLQMYTDDVTLRTVGGITEIMIDKVCVDMTIIWS